MSTFLVTVKPLTKITLFSGEIIFSVDDFMKVAKEVQKSQSVYLAWVSKLITTSAIKIVEVASPVEKFEYYDLEKLPSQIRNLMKDKIQQVPKREDITPDFLNSWMKSIQDYISMQNQSVEEIQDMSPEWIAKRKQMIQEMRERLTKKLGK